MQTQTPSLAQLAAKAAEKKAAEADAPAAAAPETTTQLAETKPQEDPVVTSATQEFIPRAEDGKFGPKYMMPSAPCSYYFACSKRQVVSPDGVIEAQSEAEETELRANHRAGCLFLLAEMQKVPELRTARQIPADNSTILAQTKQ